MEDLKTTAPILYVCAEALALGNGPALHVEGVVKELVAMGQPVTLIARGPFERQGLRFIDLGQPPAGFFYGSRLRKRVLQAVKETVLKEKFRAIYVRGSFPGLPAIAAAQKIPLIVEFNAILKDELELTGVPAWRRFLLLKRERASAESCTAAVAVNTSTQEGMMEIYPRLQNKIVIAPNGCNINIFLPYFEKPAQRDPRRLVFVGAMQDWTRLDLVIQALALLPDNVRIDIIGDGPRRKEFENLVDKLALRARVQFHGHIPNKEVAGILCQCSVGVDIEIDGFKGGFPLKLSEYMAAGCFTLINDWDCLKDLEALGHLRGLGEFTPQAIAQALSEIFESKELLLEARIKRHLYAKEHLSWKPAAKVIAGLIDHLAAPKE